MPDLLNQNHPEDLSSFLRYLALEYQDGDRLPSLPEISRCLGVSIASLREQLEVARSLGVVEVRPKTGIRRQKYQFYPAVARSLSYAVTINTEHFRQFADLRTHVESAYFREAVSRLTREDLQEMQTLVERAEHKLNRVPAQIPHNEHRNLHLLVYRRLDNPFVTGLLEAYWEMYEDIGMATYTDYGYLQTVWRYHRRMVEALVAGEIDAGYRALIEHVDLITQRSRNATRQKFE